MSFNRKEKAFGFIYFLYLGLIYATLPFLPHLVNGVKALLGPGSLIYITSAMILILALASLIYLAGRLPVKTFLIRFLPLYLASAIVFLILLDNPVEQTHLVEYGLLGYLGFRASGGADGRGQGWLWLTFSLAAGLGDEIIQGLLPLRFFDWRDVAVNLFSAALGTAAGSSLEALGRARTGRAARGPGPFD